MDDRRRLLCYHLPVPQVLIAAGSLSGRSWSRPGLRGWPFGGSVLNIPRADMGYRRSRVELPVLDVPHITPVHVPSSANLPEGS